VARRKAGSFGVARTEKPELVTTPNSLGLCGIHDWPEYLRDQAVKYRQLAEQADDPLVTTELLQLVSVCEEVSNNIEDHLTGG
jgi:hypothetical protein